MHTLLVDVVPYHCYSQTPSVFVSFCKQHESDPYFCHQLVPLRTCHHQFLSFLSVTTENMGYSYHYVKVRISINGGVKIYRIVGHYSNPLAALTEYMIVLLEYISLVY